MNEINYKGYQITFKAEDHCSLIYKAGNLVKCIAGDVKTNRIVKSRNYIDSL